MRVDVDRKLSSHTLKFPKIFAAVTIRGKETRLHDSGENLRLVNLPLHTDGEVRITFQSLFFSSFWPTVRH